MSEQTWLILIIVSASSWLVIALLYEFNYRFQDWGLDWVAEE